VTPTRAPLSLDHVFLAVSPGGPEVEPLRAAGFTEGAPNVHHGQGTACRRFFFENAYLEFLWLESRAEACSPTVSPTGLGERLGGSPGPSRIGVCVRLSRDADEAPVDTWEYRPSYLPQGLAIRVAGNSARPEEPLLFFLPPGPGREGTPPEHRNGARTISRVGLVLPWTIRRSPELEWLAGSGLADVEHGDVESLRVEVDGGAQGRRLSLAGGSPLEMVW
jgi:hypothetical protein